MITPGRCVRAEHPSLVDAFAAFICASSRLETAYDKLQLEVTRLSRELADRNAALHASLEENEQVHRALQAIVNSMPCGVLVVEGDGVISMINPEARRLLDISASSAEHLDAISLQSGVDLAGVLNWPGSGEVEQQFCRDTHHGKRWLAVRNRRLSGGETLAADSRRKQTIFILRDVTPQKQAEEERERGRTAVALSEVAMTLAHEIRNPLTSLELFAGLIAKGGEDTPEWVAHLRAGIRSLARTVSNVLSFHGAECPTLKELDLAESIKSSVEFVRPIAKEAGVQLVFTNKSLGVRVQGNDSALQQIVLNIASNAIRHTPEGGAVRVSVQKLSDRRTNREIALIEFEDTGCGIGPDYLRQIFRAGFSGSGKSSGLGLAVCRLIIQQHNGEIRVSSAPGIGTTFYVEIPAL